MHTLYLCGVLRARRHGTPRESVLMYDHVKVTLMAAPESPMLYASERRLASRWTAGEKIAPRVLVVCMFVCVLYVCFSVP